MSSYKKLPVSVLHERLRLDAETGHLFWREKRGGRPCGSRAGTQRPNGYRLISINNFPVLEHRIVFAMTQGRWPKSDVDHINGKRFDNRPKNLRECSRTENLRNRRAAGPSGAVGVCRFNQNGKWRAYIKAEGRQMHLGYFENKEDAIAARREAALKHYGQFAPEAHDA